jgi:hypothetical protein
MTYAYIIYVTPHRLSGALGRRRVHSVYLDVEKAFEEAAQRYTAQADWSAEDRSDYEVVRIQVSE